MRCSSPLLVALTLLPLASCAPSTSVMPVSSSIVFASTSTLPSAPSPVLPSALLSARFNQFLSIALSGGDMSLMFAGDRLLILTTDTFSELPRSQGASLMKYSFSLGSGCNGVCSVTFQDFLQVLSADWRSDALAALRVPVTSALAAWPSLSFSVGSHGWRISFDALGIALVAIEYFGPTPL